MHRNVLAVAMLLAACGVDPSEDARPAKVEYIVEAVLVPNCANAQCHSQFRQASGYRFDSIEASRPALTDMVAPLTVAQDGTVTGTPEETFMVQVLTRPIDRMPYDQPLPQPEIDLIKRWIADGAPGAQCDREATPQVCIGNRVVECSEDYNYGDVITDCAATGMTCQLGVCQ